MRSGYILHLYKSGEQEEEEVSDIQAVGGVLGRFVEVGEDDVERVVVWDKVDDSRGNGHHQTQEKSEPPPG